MTPPNRAAKGRAPTLELVALEGHSSPSGLSPVSAPDLATDGFRLTQNVLRPDDPVRVEIAVRNVGGGVSGPATAVVFRSGDRRLGTAAGGPSDDVRVGEVFVPGLGAGEVFRTTLGVGPFPAFGGDGFLLLGVTAAGDTRPDNNANRGPAIDAIPFAPIYATAEAEPNDETAQLVPLRTEFTGSVRGPGDVDLLRVPVPSAGRLSAAVSATGPGLDPRLELLTFDGRLLARSDDAGPADGSAEIVRHVPAGDYLLRVTAEDGAGRYALGTRFTEALPPLADIAIPPPPGGGPRVPAAVESGDFNADGVPDLVTVNRDGTPGERSVTALLGVGDGSFRPPITTPVGGLLGEGVLPPVAVADLNADGSQDVVIAGTEAGQPVSTLLGRGDGTFNPPAAVPVGGLVVRVLPDDLDADGVMDLLAVSLGGPEFPGVAPAGGAVAVLLGRGDGTLFEAARLDLGPAPAGATGADAALADTDGDGRRDLVVGLTGGGTDRLFVFGNAGGGTFAAGEPFPGEFPVERLAAGDFSGDGVQDLVVKGDSNSYTLFTGRGDGSFDGGQPLSVTDDPTAAGLAATDLDGDGVADLVAGATDPVLFRGGALAPTAIVPRRADRPGDFAAADFDGDGRTDLAVIDTSAADAGATVLSVHLGLGDGTVASPPAYTTGAPPDVLVSGDVNGDGLSDVVSATVSYGTLGRPGGPNYAVLFGHPGGGFEIGPRTSEAGAVNDAGLGDVNRDGVLDLVAVGNRLSSPGVFESSLLTRLGLGTGEFGRPTETVIGPGLYGLLLADVTGDGATDAVLRGGGDYSPARPAGAGPPASSVVLLPGLGNGGFGDAVRYSLDVYPYVIAAADIDGDGSTDLAVGGPDPSPPDTGAPAPGRITVFRGGVAGLTAVGSVTADPGLTAVEFADVNGDQTADLVTWSRGPSSSAVRVQRGDADGTFGGDPETLVAFGLEGGPPPEVPPRFRVADVNADGSLDLVVPDSGAGQFVVALGVGGGTFSAAGRSDSPGDPATFLLADVNGDRSADLLTGDPRTRSVQVQLGRYEIADGGPPVVTLAACPPDRAVGPSGTVAVADLTADGRPDTLTLDEAGRILFHEAGASGPPPDPLVVNPGRRATDTVVLDTAAGRAVAAVAADGTMTLFRRSEGGFAADDPLRVGRLPGRVSAADLNGDGFSDPVVANTLDDTLDVFLSDAAGGFPDRTLLHTDGSPAAVRFADLDADGNTDAVNLNHNSPDLGVFLNPTAADPVGLPFRAVPGVRGAIDGPAGVVVGEFDQLSGPDAVVVLRSSRQAVFLTGSGSGGFANPGAVVPLGPDPGPAAAADFDADGALDVAVVMRGSDEVWLLRGDGRGGFDRPRVTAAGTDPTGLAVADPNADGVPDLQVGDRYGGLTSLFGDGSGSFVSSRPSNAVPLAVADLNADAVPDVVLANQASGAVRALVRRPGTGEFAEAFAHAGAGALRRPNAVLAADLNLDGAQDLVVADADTGGVRVFPGGGPALFGKAVDYRTGAGPTGLTVADVSGDRLPDLLVADERSNDVRVLFGSVAGGRWQLEPGPRVRTGGAGPVGILVRDQTGDGTPDLVVSHNPGNRLSMLEGVGGGYFRSAPPTAQTLPGPSVVGETPPPAIDPDTGVGFAIGAGNVVQTFDIDSSPTGAATVAAIDPAETVVGLQVVRFPDGLGLLTATAAGRVGLSRRTETGGLEAVAVQQATGPGLLSTAVGVPAGTGIDVYFTRVGSSDPFLLTVGGSLITPPPIPPPDPTLPSTPGPAALEKPPRSDESGRTATAAPAATVTAALTKLIVSAVPVGSRTVAQDAADREQRPPGGERPPNDPGDESSSDWELFYLDLKRRLEQFSRPPLIEQRPALVDGRSETRGHSWGEEFHAAVFLRVADRIGTQPISTPALPESPNDGVAGPTTDGVEVGPSGSNHAAGLRGEDLFLSLVFWPIWERMRRAKRPRRGKSTPPVAQLQPVTCVWP